MTRSISPTAMSVILGLVAAVGPFAIDMYLPAMPDIGRDLSASQHAVQWTIIGYFITFGLAQLVYGPWADQAGRKPPLYVGLALFILVAGLTGSIGPRVNRGLGLFSAVALFAFGLFQLATGLRELLG